MKVTAFKTHKITEDDCDINKILDQYLPNLQESCIVVVVSKIVAITEGRVFHASHEQLEEIIKEEADWYLPKEVNKYNLYITIKNNYLTFSSGIDESNVESGYVLWPKNPQGSANLIRQYLAKRYGLKNIGVIITDMAALPLQRGVIGGAIAFSGFKPLNDITGTSDLFGREFKYTRVGIFNGLAATASVVMGEGAEQTPIGLIEDIGFVEFVDRDPTEEELKSIRISFDEDLYGPMLKALDWEKA